MERKQTPKVDKERPLLSGKVIKSATTRWQERLLPTMVSLLIGLTLFFFAATFIQMSYLHWSILQYPPPDLSSTFSEDLAISATTFDDKLEIRRLEILASMESYLIDRRYHHASVLLMSGLWIRYLGFVTGMLLALVGASFILGKLREPSTEIAGKAPSFDLSLKSTSPGIILVVLGTALMLTTILNQDVYQVQDAPMYLGSQTQLTTLDLSTPIPVSTIEDPERNLATPTQLPP